MRASSTHFEAASDVTEVGYVLKLNSISVINEGRADIASSVAKVASKNVVGLEGFLSFEGVTLVLFHENLFTH